MTSRGFSDSHLTVELGGQEESDEDYVCSLCEGSDPESCPLCGVTEIQESSTEEFIAESKNDVSTDAETDRESIAEEEADDEWQCRLCKGSGLYNEEVCCLCGGENL